MDKARLMKQLEEDEGFRAKAYFDIKQYTVGFGTLAKTKDEVITREDASKRLEAHVDIAIAHFNKIFKHELEKFNDVRAEAFTNMIFNMGPGRSNDSGAGGLQSFVNTLNLIYKNKTVPWRDVALNLAKSKWYTQVGTRAKRIVKEVETGEKA